MNTAQEVFEKIAAHLEWQNARCVNDENKLIAYKNKHFFSPIGVFLNNVHGVQVLARFNNSRTEPEDLPKEILHPYEELLFSLESMHDFMPVEQWNGQLHAIAKEFGLTYKGVDYGAPKQVAEMMEYSYSIEFPVRLPSDEKVTDRQLIDALNLAFHGEGRPKISEQVECKSVRVVKKRPYGLTIDVRLPHNHSLVTRVGLMAYDQYDAISSLRAHLQYPDVSDMSILKVETATDDELDVLQRIDV